MQHKRSRENDPGRRKTTKNWIPRNSHYIYLYACNIYSIVVLSLFFFLRFLFHSWIRAARFFSCTLCHIIIYPHSCDLPVFFHFCSYIYVIARIVAVCADFKCVCMLSMYVHLCRLWWTFVAFCSQFVFGYVWLLHHPVQIPAYVRCKIARNLSLSLLTKISHKHN